MKKLYFLLPCLFILCLNAKVNFTPKKQLLLTGESCEEIIPYAQAIIDWAQSVTSSATTQLPLCYCAEDECLMDVFPISPYFVRLYTTFQEGFFSSSSAFQGPNCFNAALVSSATLPKINFTHPYELSVILDSPLCTERLSDEELLPGDLIIVRDQTEEFFEVHAGTYINENLSFNKYGEGKMLPYSYGTEVQLAYGVTNPECKRIYGIPTPGSTCFNQTFANYFHCRTLYGFVSEIVNSPQGLNEELRELYAETSGIDMDISKVSLSGVAITKEELKKDFSILKKLFNEGARLARRLDGDQASLAKILQFHAFSLHEQARRIAGSKGLFVPRPLRVNIRRR